MLIKPKKSTGLFFRVSSLLTALALALAFGAYLKASSGGGRVVVLGFDGADFRLVTQGIADGKLPNLKRLAEAGGFVPLSPTIPAQTPVSWSTFSTGISPGRTQIFDFLKRDPKTYRPEFAVADEGKKAFLFGEKNSLFFPMILAAAGALLGLLGAALFRAGGKVLTATAATLAIAGAAFGVKAASLVPKTVPTVHNNRLGVPFWEAAGKRGIEAVVLHVPVTFPADDFPEGRLLSGLGVPDVRGRIGTPSFYTSDPFFAPKNSNEFSVELMRLDANKGTIKTEVVGPYNKLFAEPAVIKTPMTLTVLPDGKHLAIAPEGSAPLTLGVGEWSPWVTFTFKFNSLVKLSAIGRFHLASLSPEVQLYLSPLQFDPSALPPAVKITAPASFAKSLWKKFGLFKTMGWQIDTWSMSEETIDEKTFLEDVSFTALGFRRMMNDFLEDKSVRLYVQIYEFTDRVGHCFWRFLDPKHPAYDAAKAATWAPAVMRNYQLMDAIVGDAMQKLGKDDVLLVVSDHGFATWRRSVNYDTWLVENGYMTITGSGDRANLEQLFGQGQFWPNVDWSKTKAYAMGLGEIYINVKGREGKGIVAPGAEYEAVRNEIKTRLVSLTDPKTGEKAVSRVLTREEAYGSFDADVIPDLFVTNTAGYRIGWQGSLGVVTPELFEDNAQIWSGDHCSVDPDIVPGILLANRKIPNGARPGIADVPATILKALDVPAPQKLDGAPVF